MVTACPRVAARSFSPLSRISARSLSTAPQVRQPSRAVTQAAERLRQRERDRSVKLAMIQRTFHRRPNDGFTMIEMILAMVASAFLLAGLGSTMFIARQVAYAPTHVHRRSKTADVINQISGELRY